MEREAAREPIEEHEQGEPCVPYDENRVKRFDILKINHGVRQQVEDTLVLESPLTIFLNDEELVTLLCTPEDIKFLAVGFLAAEGLLAGKDDIAKIVTDEDKGVVWVETVKNREMARDMVFKRLITSACGKGTTFYNVVDASACQPVSSDVTITADQALHLAEEMQRHSLLYKDTGGVHNAALADSGKILIFGEDIGRHNAIDKIYGRCILEGIPIHDKIILTTGRISSEILLKVVKNQIPVIISRSAPTTLAVNLARKLGITVVGFARGKRMNIYSHEERIV